MNDRASELLGLLESVGPQLHRVLTRLTLREDVAEELMQELFISLSESRAFDRAADPGAYAYRAAVNLAFGWRRSQRRVQAMVERFEPYVPQDPGLLARLAADEELQQVLEAIEDLPELQRNVVTMRYVQQDSYETIARMFDKTPAQARALCHKGIRSLRCWFSDEETASRLEGVSHVES